MAEFSNMDRKLDKLVEWIENRGRPSTDRPSRHAATMRDVKVEPNESKESIEKQDSNESKQTKIHLPSAERQSNDSKRRNPYNSIITEIPGNIVTTYLVKDAKT